jgi:hypothetical protein
VVGVVNIGSRRIGGIESDFLLLGGYGKDGTVRLLAPDPGAQPGDAVGQQQWRHVAPASTAYALLSRLVV